MNLTSSTSFLVFLASLTPEISDALKPHLPLVSQPARHIRTATLLRQISFEIKNPSTAQKIETAAKQLFHSAIDQLSFEDDALLFFPAQQSFRWMSTEEVMLNPQPLPPQSQAYYGALIMLLANTVTIESISSVLATLGNAIIEPSASYAS